MTDFHELRKQLEAQQKDLQEKLARIETDKRAAHSPDSEEQAQERENDEVLNALAFETKKKLADVTLALTRMDKNLYGLCFLCGKPINPERLQAKPEAVSCVTCV